MDMTTVALFVVESVILLAALIVSGYQIYKSHKGKTSLNVEDILELSKQLYNYANEVYATASKFNDICPANFNSQEEYKSFLISKIIEDFDELAENDVISGINKTLYNSLSDEAKKKIAEYIVDKSPKLETDSESKDLSNEESAIQTNGDEIDSDPGYDTVDIGDYL